MTATTRTLYSLGAYLLAFLLTTCCATRVYALSEVIVNFAPTSGGAYWGGNLDTLTAGVGMDPVSPAELTDLETIIMTELERIYVGAGFAVTFAPHTAPTPAPASTNYIDFTKDETTSVNSAPVPLPKGIAPTDWLNRQFFTPQSAEVFPQSFDDIVDEWAGSTAGARGGMIAELGVALAGTAAHELAHTYGLSHWDAYGLPSIGPASYGPVPPPPGMAPESIIFDSMGFQNGSILATGATGLDEAGRETMRELSRYSKAKLEIAADPAVTPEPLTTMPFFHTTEAPVLHDTFATAQPVSSTLLPISGLHAANVHAASLGLAPGVGLHGLDLYEFTTEGAGLVSVEVLSTEVYAPYLETTLTIYDAAMTPIFGSDDFSYGDGFPSMVFSTYGAPIDSLTDGDEDDPLVMNMELPDGTYFVEVAVDVDGVHSAPPATAELFYDLLITSETSFSLIPEPATVLLVGWAVMLQGGVRRRG